MRLTEHFDLSEFTRSATAERHNIDNTIPEQYIPDIKRICEEVLEPLREYIGNPITISSGYRCPELNKLVGGVRNSQHKFGRAVDICTQSESVLMLSFVWLAREFHTKYKILLETKNNKQWIHIELRRK